jgi:hypothetical protein
MNQTIVLIVVNVLAVAFVAAFAWWYGKRVSRSVPLGARPLAVSEGDLPAAESLGAQPPSQATLRGDQGTLGGGSTPSEAEGGVRPGGVIRGESPLAASHPRQDVPRPSGFDGRYRITVRDGEPFQVGGRATANDNEVQP